MSLSERPTQREPGVEKGHGGCFGKHDLLGGVCGSSLITFRKSALRVPAPPFSTASSNNFRYSHNWSPCKVKA
jgi:hypothetical protein